MYISVYKFLEVSGLWRDKHTICAIRYSTFSSAALSRQRRSKFKKYELDDNLIRISESEATHDGILLCMETSLELNRDKSVLILIAITMANIVSFLLFSSL
jgi:hypothetical protein